MCDGKNDCGDNSDEATGCEGKELRGIPLNRNVATFILINKKYFKHNQTVIRLNY